MRKLLLAVAAITALWAAPAAAQEIDEAQAERDMECLLFISIMVGMEMESDRDAASAMMMGLAYFTGHYEATTGRSIADDYDHAVFERVAMNPDRYAEPCGNRMIGAGEGMQALGNLIEQNAPAEAK